MPDRPVVCGAAEHCRFDDRQRYAHARSSGLSVPHGQSLRLLFPGVALILDGCDAGMELTGIDGGLQGQVLGGRELLTQLVDLCGPGRGAAPPSRRSRHRARRGSRIGRGASIRPTSRCRRGLSDSFSRIPAPPERGAEKAQLRRAFVRPSGLRTSAHGSGRATTLSDSRRNPMVEVARCPPAAFRRLFCSRI